MNNDQDSTSVPNDLLRRLESLLRDVRSLPALREVSGVVVAEGGRLLFQVDPPVTLDGLERQYIAHILDLKLGNKTHAAEILGIDASTLYRKIQRYQLQASVRE